MNKYQQLQDRHILGSKQQFLSTLSQTTNVNIEEQLKEQESQKAVPEEKYSSAHQNREESSHHGTKRVKFYSEDKQQRALDHYAEVQQEWNKISDRLGQKLGKDPRRLIMERSQGDYRSKIEEVSILEASIPPEHKYNEMSWEMSLRNNHLEGVRYVKVGGNWPYPLYCPVVNKRPYTPATIRNPLKGEEINKESLLGIRNQESKYVKDKYSNFLKKTMAYDPISEISNLIVAGKSVQNTDSSLEYEPGEEVLEGEEFRVDEEDMEKELQHAQRNEQGPSFSLSNNQIVFQSDPFQLAQCTVVLANNGSCALKYNWQNLEYIDELQKKRAYKKFQLTTESSGVILPNTKKNFLFSFKSDIEGIFTDGYQLVTIPAIDPEQCNPIIRVKGVCIKNSTQMKQSDYQERLREMIAELHTEYPIIQVSPVTQSSGDEESMDEDLQLKLKLTEQENAEIYRDEDKNQN